MYTLSRKESQRMRPMREFLKTLDGRIGEWYEHELRLRGSEVGALECCGCYPPLDKGFKRDKRALKRK